MSQVTEMCQLSIVLWSLEIEPGDVFEVHVKAHLQHIKLAAVRAKLAISTGCTAATKYLDLFVLERLDNLLGSLSSFNRQA